MLVFDDLTVPRPKSDTARRLFGEYLRHVARHFFALGAASPPLSQVVAFARDRLRSAPGAVFAALRQPTVSVLVRLIDGAATPNATWNKELAALVLVELALAGELPPREIVIDCPSRLCLAGAGRALDLPPGTRLSAGPSGVRFDGRDFDLGIDDAAALDAYHPIESGIVLATVDNNPLAHVEAHPEKAGNRVDLGERGPTEWVGSLCAALGIVRSRFPEMAREIELGVRLVVPVGYSEERHDSASYAEAVGTIYSSLHPDPLIMAEALVHEHSHGKLNALSALAPLLHNPDGAFHSPLRPDPRPLSGVLLAAHALVSIAALHQRLRAAKDPLACTPRAQRRFHEVVEQGRVATQTLIEDARPTPAGAALFGELERWLRAD